MNTKEVVRDYLLEIRKKALEIQHKIDENKNIGKFELKNFKFTGILAALNESGNASKIILRPIKCDDGSYRIIGLMANELKFFKNSGQPIIITNNIEVLLTDLTKDIDDLLNNEKMVIEILADECQSDEAINSIKEIYEFVLRAEVEDGAIVKPE